MAIIVPDILVSDGTKYRSLRNNYVLDNRGTFRQVTEGCGVANGLDYYVLGGYEVIPLFRICAKKPDPIVISDFDYLVFRYVWTDADGRDLDTVTVISEPADLTVNGSRVGNEPVGYGCGAYNVLSVIQNPGDNQGSGSESVSFDFRSFTGLDAEAIPRIVIESYCTWYNSKRNGNVRIEITAYKGGDMKKNSNYEFVNEGGEVRYKEITDLIYINATKRGPNLTVSDYQYSHALTLVYDTQSGRISLTPYYG